MLLSEENLLCSSWTPMAIDLPSGQIPNKIFKISGDVLLLGLFSKYDCNPSVLFPFYKKVIASEKLLRS